MKIKTPGRAATYVTARGDGGVNVVQGPVRIRLNENEARQVADALIDAIEEGPQ